MVVHIELDKAPDGEALLEEIGALDHMADWIPFPFGVDAQGRFVAPLGERDTETGDQDATDEESEAKEDDEPVSVGYDRRRLRERVLSLHDAIQSANR